MRTNHWAVFSGPIPPYSPRKGLPDEDIVFTGLDVLMDRKHNASRRNREAMYHPHPLICKANGFDYHALKKCLYAAYDMLVKNFLCWNLGKFWYHLCNCLSSGGLSRG